MTIATLTSKGQTTIPKDIREQAGLQPGDRMHFTVIGGGAIMLRVKRRGVADIKGLLNPRKKLRTTELSR